jgi:hypothetical protein
MIRTAEALFHIQEFEAFGVLQEGSARKLILIRLWRLAEGAMCII